MHSARILTPASVNISFLVQPGSLLSNSASPDKSTLDEMFEFQKAVIKEGIHTQSDYWDYFMVALIVACDLAKMKSELMTNRRKMQKYRKYYKEQADDR